MTKSGLVEALAAKMPHLSQRDLEVVVNTLFDAMTDALGTDDRIEIRGFGSFSVRERRSRTGRNPKTGALIEVPAKRVPFFTVGQDLKDRVDRGGTRFRDENPQRVARTTSLPGDDGSKTSSTDDSVAVSVLRPTSSANV